MVGKQGALSPTSAEVAAHIRAVRKRHPRWVKITVVDRTAEKRPIYAVTITDPDIKASTKQHALIVAGQHGNEESSRAIALALIDWLVSRAGTQTRRRQKVVVMPNVSPDACEADVYLPPASNKNPNRYGVRTPEARAIEAVATKLVPDAFCDVHARGGAGCGTDMVLFPGTKQYTVDDHLFHAIAAAMAAAGERLGPAHVVHPLTWSGWSGKAADYAYRQFHAISMLTETAEHNDHAYTLADRALVGLDRLKVLLSHGNSRHPKLQHPGYPCLLPVGQFAAGVTAVGRSAAARRRSRMAIWKNAHRFTRAGMLLPEPELHKTFVLQYEGPPIAVPIGIQLAVRGQRRIESVTVDGNKVKAATAGGDDAWLCANATYAVVALPGLRRGQHEIRVNFAR